MAFLDGVLKKKKNHYKNPKEIHTKNRNKEKKRKTKTKKTKQEGNKRQTTIDGPKKKKASRKKARKP
jgi:hypothetical protein